MGSKVAVDLGSTGIKAVQFSGGKRPTIERVGYAPLPPGAFVNGEPVDHGTIAATLRGLWKAAKFSSKQAVVGLVNTQVEVKKLDLEWRPDKHFAKALPYLAKDHLQTDTADAVVAFHPVARYSEDVNGTPRPMQTVMVVAAPKALVASVVSPFTAAGLTVTKADLSPFALIRAAADQPAPASDPSLAEVLVDVGADMTIVVVHRGGRPLFVRFVPAQAGTAVTTALCRSFGWSYEEAERSKIALGLSPAVSAASVESVFGAAIGGAAKPPGTHEAHPVIDAAVSEFVTDIRNTLRFFVSNTPEGVTGFSRVLLSGGSARFAGLPERLAAEVGAPAMLAHPAASASFKRGAAVPDGMSDAQYMIATGLAMGAA